MRHRLHVACPTQPGEKCHEDGREKMLYISVEWPRAEKADHPMRMIVVTLGLLLALGMPSVWSQPAASMGATPSREAAARQLASFFPLVNTIKKKFPSLYGALEEYWVDGLSRGKPVRELTDDIRRKLMEIGQKFILYADDDVLVRYNKLLVEKYEQLGVKDSKLCYLCVGRWPRLPKFF
jgi:hypothetical protein